MWIMKAVSFTTLMSVPAALRWLRRGITLMLILANFAIAMWGR